MPIFFENPEKKVFRDSDSVYDLVKLSHDEILKVIKKNGSIKTLHILNMSFRDMIMLIYIRNRRV